MIEIWENWNENTWKAEIIKQIKEQTGTEISSVKFNDLKKYIGNHQT